MNPILSSFTICIRYIYPQIMPIKLIGNYRRSSSSIKWIQHDISLIAEKF
mgnify:CR=1 FL=1